MGPTSGAGEATTSPDGDAVGDGKAGFGLGTDRAVVGPTAPGTWVARAMLVGRVAGAGGALVQETASAVTRINCKVREPRQILEFTVNLRLAYGM